MGRARPFDMNILRSFERTVGGLLEGVFGSVFRSEVRPIELAHKLCREMDEHRTASVSRVYAPNEYLVWLSPEDRAHYAGVEDEVVDELCAYLLEHARREELTLASRPVVTFNTDERLSLGEFGIQARLVRLPDNDAQHAARSEPDVAGGRGGGGRESPDERRAERGHTMIYNASERESAASPEVPARRSTRAFVHFDGRRLLVAPAGAVLGRSRGCDIVLEDPGVSRRHAEIRAAPDGWVIRDLGSTNGVYLNRSPIDGPTELRSGDHIELGETEIVFEAP
jgi:Protein of unknown function (DUF3662)/FHA domain